MPLKRRPVAPLRFQSEKAIQRPKTSGKTTIATVKSTAGSTKSVRLPRSPRISTWATPSATAQSR